MQHSLLSPFSGDAGGQHCCGVGLLGGGLEWETHTDLYTFLVFLVL